MEDFFKYGKVFDPWFEDSPEVYDFGEWLDKVGENFVISVSDPSVNKQIKGEVKKGSPVCTEHFCH